MFCERAMEMILLRACVVALFSMHLPRQLREPTLILGLLGSVAMGLDCRSAVKRNWVNVVCLDIVYSGVEPDDGVFFGETGLAEDIGSVCARGCRGEIEGGSGDFIVYTCVSVED